MCVLVVCTCLFYDGMLWWCGVGEEIFGTVADDDDTFDLRV